MTWQPRPATASAPSSAPRRRPAAPASALPAPRRSRPRRLPRRGPGPRNGSRSGGTLLGLLRCSFRRAHRRDQEVRRDLLARHLEAALHGAFVIGVLHPGLLVGIPVAGLVTVQRLVQQDRKSTRLNSSHVEISYAVFCLKKKKK